MGLKTMSRGSTTSPPPLPREVYLIIHPARSDNGNLFWGGGVARESPKADRMPD